MDWILAPWMASLAGGWLLAVGYHAVCLLPARESRGGRR
jgi:hypothetical protein